MTWRERLQPVISQVIRDTGASDLRFLRRALRAAWPYPPRGRYAYRVWLREIRRQLNLPAGVRGQQGQQGRQGVKMVQLSFFPEKIDTGADFESVPVR